MELDEVVSRIADCAGDGIAVLERYPGRDGEVAIAWCNDALLALLGRTRAEVLGRPVAGFCAPDAATKTALAAGFKTGAGFRAACRCHDPAGAEIRLDCSFAPGPETADLPERWVATVRAAGDEAALIDRLRQERDHAAQARDRLVAALEALPDGFVMYDTDDRLVLCNERYREIYAATGAIFEPGVRFEDLLREGLAQGQYPEAAGREEAWLAERMQRHLNPTDAVIQELPGNRFLKIHEVRTPSGDIVGFRADVTELQRQRQKLVARTEALAAALVELEKVSKTDTLTGLDNRRGLDMALDAAMEDAAPGAQAALLHIDLDRFKPINDVFGHAAGDFILQHVAAVLRACVRRGDCVARVGGDEFVVFLPRRRAADLDTDAGEISRRIIQDCSKPVAWRDKTLHFGTSVGIATGPLSEARRLIQNADIALYAAKQGGRSRAAPFTPELRRAAEARKQVGDEFLVALDRGDIVAHFQPQVDARSGRLAGVEALVRWHHGERGVIAPDAFLPVVRDLGMLADVDKVVLDYAHRFARDCTEVGIALPKISVNISYPSLQVLRDRRVLQEIGDWPCKLAFELLETIDFDIEGNHMEWILDQIRELGIEIELDDFGSGRASLTTLLNIRPDRIKVDRRIVGAAFASNPAANAMIHAIVEMADSLGISLTAEGIETEKQARRTRELGFGTLQGFLFGRPLPREQMLDLLLDDPECRRRWARPPDTTQRPAGDRRSLAGG